jgi:hypothetical protein
VGKLYLLARPDKLANALIKQAADAMRAAANQCGFKLVY